MENCNSCGGSFNPVEREYFVGIEHWNGKCHACALHSPEYAAFLEADLAAVKADLSTEKDAHLEWRKAYFDK